MAEFRAEVDASRGPDQRVNRDAHGPQSAQLRLGMGWQPESFFCLEGKSVDCHASAPYEHTSFLRSAPVERPQDLVLRVFIFAWNSLRQWSRLYS